MPIEPTLLAGQVWAYRQGTTHPLVRALILNAGATWGSDVRIRLLDDHQFGELWVTRAKLPCLWKNVTEFLLEHPEVPQTYGPTPAPEPRLESLVFHANELRAIVHDEVAAAIGVQKLAYIYDEAATAVGYSKEVLRLAVHRNELIPSCVNTKPVFTVEELKRWLASLPDEPH